MTTYRLNLQDCQTKQGVIDESVLLCMKNGIKPTGKSVSIANETMTHEDQGIPAQLQQRKPGLFERLILPSQDAQRYAQLHVDQLQNTPTCTSFRDAILEAGKGSRFEGSTLSKILTIFEQAKTAGCLASSSTRNTKSQTNPAIASDTQSLTINNPNSYHLPVGTNNEAGFLIPLICLAVGYWLGKKRRQTEENQGEAAVRNALSKTFTGTSYHLLNNITLPLLDGTTQIDHILVSTKGIFVIETKHYNGWIFGDARSSKWTQVLNKNTRNPFQNPIQQNYLHVKTIQRMLDFVPNEHVHSMVVFTGEAKFKTAIPPNVYNLKSLINSLHKFQKDVLTESNLFLSVGRLECKRKEISGKTDVEHVAHLNKKFGNLR